MKPNNLPIEEQPRGNKWQVGTLSYTTGGLAVLFAWLLWGDFAYQMRDRTVLPVMQYLFKNIGASDMLSGILFSSLPAAFGMVIGPIVGYRSDRLRSSWGRRIPFLALPVPFIVLSIAGLALSPAIGSLLLQMLGSYSPDLNGWILISMAFFWTTFELSCIVANSVFGALVNDVVPQPVIGRFMGLFRAISLIAGILVSFWLLGPAKTHFTPIFLVIAAIYGVGFTVMCLKVREGEYPPPAAASDSGLLSVVIAYFRDSFGQPYYLWFFAASTLGNLAIVPVNLFAVAYSNSVGVDYGTCLGWTYIISLILAYPLAMLADRFHPLPLTLGMLALYALVMLWGVLFVNNGHTFFIALIAHGVISGAFFTAYASLPQRLLPWGKFAEISSAGGIIGSIAGIIAGPAIGLVLDHVHHDYSYTFQIGFIIAAASMVATYVLLIKFRALGGTTNYRAPE